MASLHDVLDKANYETTLEMNSIEGRAVGGDDIAWIAIAAAGGSFFHNSIEDDFDPIPEGVNPYPIPVGKTN